MRNFAKLGVAALMLGGAAAMSAAPADAGVSVGVNIGVPGVVVGPRNPCYRPLPYRPAYCGYPVYAEPLYIGGVWYRGPVHYRLVGGAREFWFNGGWHRDRDDFHPAFHGERGDMHR